MKELNFITPTDVLMNQIKKDEKLVALCSFINEHLNEFSFGNTSLEFKEIPISGEIITLSNLYLIRNLYKRFGWKVVVTYSNKTDTTTNLYNITIQESF